MRERILLLLSVYESLFALELVWFTYLLESMLNGGSLGEIAPCPNLDNYYSWPGLVDHQTSTGSREDSIQRTCLKLLIHSS